MGLLSLLKPKGPSGFSASSTAEEVTAGLDLSGKTFLLTGCNSGLGLETLRVLRLRGARVLATARTAEKAREAIDACPPRGDGTPASVPLACELSEPASVRACVEEAKKDGAALDGIIANAGIMALPSLETRHGLELQFLTNHVGHFILVTGLLDRLSEDGRVVVVSSRGHKHTPREGIDFDNLAGEKSYERWRAYGRLKLANILFAKALAPRLGARRTANALHPGVIGTGLARNMGAVLSTMYGIASSALLKSIPQGAATQCWAACHPDLAGVSGKYFEDCNVRTPSALAEDAALAARLWDETERIVARDRSG